MKGQDPTRLSRLFEHVPQGASAIAVLVGILVLFGWLFDVAPLKSVFSGLVTMKANTALGFILAGVSLWSAGAERRLPRIVSRFCGGGVLLLGLLVLAEYRSGADFGIDQLLFRDIARLPGDIPGRMAVSTAACFAALGAALVLLSRERRGSVVAVHALATVPTLVAGAALVSYGYDIEAFLRFNLNYTPMALHTAAVFVVLSLGVVSARPDYPFRRILTSDSAAGSTARRLLPASIGLQLAMGWLLLSGLQAGYLSEAVGLALFVVTNIGGLVALIQWNALRLYRADTQRSLAEEALRKSAEEIEDLYNRAPIGYHSVDKNGTLVRMNDTELAWLGYTRDEVIGRMNFADLLTPESLKTFRETFAGSKARGWVSDLEYDLVRKDGSILPVLLSATAVRDAQGNFVMSRSTIYDITERKRNEALNAVRLHLVQFAQTHSLDELLEETLNEAERLTGSLIGFYHFVEEDQSSLTLQAWSTRTKAVFCKAEGKGLHYPIADAGVWADCARQGKPVIHNDYAALPHRKGMPEGHAKVIREVVVPVRRGQKLSAILGVGNKPGNYTEKDVEALLMTADLTGEIAARKRAEEALHKSAEELNRVSAYTRSLIEASLDPLVTISAEGQIMDVNQATERVTGSPRERLIGSDFSDYFTEPDKARQGYLQVLAEGFVNDYPLAIRHVSGKVTEVLYNATVFKNEAGEVQGVFAAARDITERKRAEKQIRERMKELQAFFRLSEIAERRDFALDSLYRELANFLPESWQYPDIACARIVMGESEFRTPNFGVSEWMQAAPIKVLGAVVGKIEVGYLEQKPEENEGPFLKEERRLINAIAVRVGHITELKRTEDALKQASAYTRSLIEASLDPLVTISSEGKIMDVNQATERVTGRPRAQLIGSDFLDYFTEPERARQGYRQVLAEGFVKDYPLAISDVAGRVTDVLYNATVFRNEAGEVQGVFAAARDITERKRAEEALRESEERYRSVIAALFEGVILMDADGAIRASNTSAERILGLTVEQMAGRTTLDPRWQAVHEDGSPFPGEMHPAWVTLRTGEPRHNVIQGVQKPDGTLIWVSINSQALYRPLDTKPYAVVASFADITERKRIEEELRVLQARLREEAIHDPLTGLYNRRYLEETLRRELARAGRDGHPLSVLMGDIDFFKRLNDTYGHQAGDEVLRTLGHVLQHHARSSDIPCRYGGEEFVVVLPDMPPEAARARAELLRRDFADLRIASGGAELVATLSIGVSDYPGHGKTADELIGAADLALYEAKRTGRNRVCYAGPSDH